MVSKLANHKGKPKSFASSHVAFFDPSQIIMRLCKNIPSHGDIAQRLHSLARAPF
jgi:hypothetical protein